jgi:hypothetical protein
MTKQYYMFIPLDIDKDKNTRFVVETDGIIPTDKAFSGKVVARNKKKLDTHSKKQEKDIVKVAKEIVDL